MPRTAYFSKEEIIAKALQLVRRQGEEKLSARTLSKALNCSVSPLFTQFRNMDEIVAETRNAAQKLFSEYVADVTDYHPAFKEFGLRLFHFSQKEPNLFHYLFMHKQASSENIHPKALECIEGICDRQGITKQQAEVLFNQMWVFVVGLAMLCHKVETSFSEESVSEMISRQFFSTLEFIKSGKTLSVPTPERKK